MIWRPLTLETWRDFEELFGERGACGGCWCMVWRLPRRVFEKGKGASNRRAMRKLAGGARPPGVLVYDQGQAVGWCSVAPRDEFPVLQRSRTLKPLDDQPVWSISCFFVRKDCRGRGVGVELLKAAEQFVRAQGGRILEGYPVVARKGRMPDVFVWMGVPEIFKRAGFTEYAQPSAARKILRKQIGAPASPRTPVS